MKDRKDLSQSQWRFNNIYSDFLNMPNKWEKRATAHTLRIRQYIE